MNLMLFAIVVIVSFVIVRIGAIAFQLTGLEWSLAKFQSLSCFTGTGFTTKEAELITGNAQRRRIASVLMVLGNAGLVTLIATFANTLRPHTLVPQIKIPFLHFVFPARLLPYVNLFFVILFAFIFYMIFTHTRLTKKITDMIRARIIKRELIKPVLFEELLVAAGGYGISQIEVCKDSPIVNKRLGEADLRGLDINLLAIERKGETIPNPKVGTEFLLGDKLICFGKLENIRNKLCKI